MTRTEITPRTRCLLKLQWVVTHSFLVAFTMNSNSFKKQQCFYAFEFLYQDISRKLCSWTFLAASCVCKVARNPQINMPWWRRRKKRNTLTCLRRAKSTHNFFHIVLRRFSDLSEGYIKIKERKIFYRSSHTHFAFFYSGGMKVVVALCAMVKWVWCVHIYVLVLLHILALNILTEKNVITRQCSCKNALSLNGFLNHHSEWKIGKNSSAVWSQENPFHLSTNRRNLRRKWIEKYGWSIMWLSELEFKFAFTLFISQPLQPIHFYDLCGCFLLESMKLDRRR